MTPRTYNKKDKIVRQKLNTVQEVHLFGKWQPNSGKSIPGWCALTRSHRDPCYRYAYVFPLRLMPKVICSLDTEYGYIPCLNTQAYDSMPPYDSRVCRRQFCTRRPTTCSVQAARHLRGGGWGCSGRTIVCSRH